MPRLNVVTLWSDDVLRRFVRPDTDGSYIATYGRAYVERLAQLEIAHRYNAHCPSGEEVCSCGAIRTCGECDSCDECCECSECEHYRCTRRGEVCSDCNRCERHCECYECDGCGCRVNGECECCGRCEECERIRPYDSMVRGLCESCREERGDLAWVKPSGRKWGSGRYIGIEAEYASGEPDPEWARIWGAGIVEDGSLPRGGYELVSAPAAGELFEAQIREMCRGAGDVTTACGLHVHVDASDYTWADMRRLIFAYASIEDELFRAVPESRRNNHYCTRCAADYVRLVSRTAGTEEKIIACTGNIKLRLQRDAKPSGRYRALNLCCWFRQGTVELRLGAGSANPSKIISWASFFRDLVGYAKTHPLKACRVATIEAISPEHAPFIRKRQEELN